jgi:hypothetical protein
MNKFNTEEYVSSANVQDKYPPLECVTRPTVGTDQAAFYLGVKPQTLRIWACYETGPIERIKIKGRNHYRVPVLKGLLRVETDFQIGTVNGQEGVQ